MARYGRGGSNVPVSCLLAAAVVAEALAAGEPGGPLDFCSAESAESPGHAAGPGSAGVRRPVAIEFSVHCPMHVAPESARLHAELALLADGLEDVAITVSFDPESAHLMCEVANEVQAGHPFGSECG